jgi:hypothetical protein
MHGGGPAHGVGRRLRQAEVTNLPGRDEFGHRPDRLLDGDLRIWAVQVVQVDVIDAEALQRALDRAAHVLRPSVNLTPAGLDRTAGHDAELRRQRHLVAARGDRPADDLLADVRPVHVGRVEQRDTKIEGAGDRRRRVVAIETAIHGAEAHAPQAEGAGGDLAATECAGGNAAVHDDQARAARPTERLDSTSAWTDPRIPSPPSSRGRVYDT